MKNEENIKGEREGGMTRTEIKENARRELLIAMQTSFSAITERNSGSYIEDDTERQAVFAEMDKQMERVEKIFGYVPGSWARGV